MALEIGACAWCLAKCLRPGVPFCSVRCWAAYTAADLVPQQGCAPRGLLPSAEDALEEEFRILAQHIASRVARLRCEREGHRPAQLFAKHGAICTRCGGDLAA